MPDLRMFVQNIWLLITCLVLLVVFAALALAVYVCLRYLLQRYRVARSEAAHHAARFRPDGTAYPPQAEGLCQCCSKVLLLYYLPDGRKLCPACYHALYPAALAPPADCPTATPANRSPP